MTMRGLQAKLNRLEAKIAIRWSWQTPLWIWPEDQRALLFAVIVRYPGWLATWPAERGAWLCRALEHIPHLFPDRVLEVIAFAAPLRALPAPPLLLPAP
jgi:hypothetical protein